MTGDLIEKKSQNLGLKSLSPKESMILSILTEKYPNFAGCPLFSQ
jgi:hypothetical protein